MALVSNGKTYTLTAPHASYPDTGGVELTDGAVGPLDPLTAWVGWSSVSPTARIDLGAAYNLGYVRFHYYIWEVNGLYSPNQLIVYGSNNDVDYANLGTFVKVTNWTDGGAQAVYWSNNLVVTGSYRYIKFAFTYQTAWIFLSELQVYSAGGGFFLMF